jgi:glucokinase
MNFLGVDIGGTKIAVGVVNAAGSVVASKRVSTPAAEGGEAVLSAAVNASRELLAEAGVAVNAIGIGAGGQIDSDNGLIVSATDLLPGWAGQPVVKTFSDVFQLPVKIDNDVNALAVGEHKFGSSVGLKSACFIALGTGVGGALVLDGQVLHGAHWSAGEFGHLIVDMSESARIDAGGHKGTLEAYASGSGLVATWRNITGETTAISAVEIAEEAKADAGGAAALALGQTGRYLGFGLVSIVSMFDPDIIVVGGGLAEIGDMLLDNARTALLERALDGAASCPVVIGTLGLDGSIIGAAALAMVNFR